MSDRANLTNDPDGRAGLAGAPAALLVVLPGALDGGLRADRRADELEAALLDVQAEVALLREDLAALRASVAEDSELAWYASARHEERLACQGQIIAGLATPGARRMGYPPPPAMDGGS